jgi:hypothetical protein
VIFEIASGMSMLEEFRDVYGMRFVGLEDQLSSVYNTYRVPDPEAPYPQDYVIDQDGIVRYWSWEYDPHEVMETIDRLLSAAGVDDDPPSSDGHTGLRLAPPAPNPFRGGTALRFEIPESARVELSVYSVTGALVGTLVNETRDAGEHLVNWDGRDNNGQPVASGVYFIDLSVGDERQTRRVALLR